MKERFTTIDLFAILGELNQRYVIIILVNHIVTDDCITAVSLE